MIQDGEGVRTSGVAVQGGSFNVEVGPNDTSVEVNAGGTGDISSHEVGSGKSVTIPVPNVPSGTLLFISVGKGSRMRLITIEVIAPPPLGPG